jgi:hypothetical protein
MGKTVSGENWLVKQGAGLFATDEESALVLAGIEEGECTPWELIGVRDPVSFKKYWKMCDTIAKNVREIEIDRMGPERVRMPVFERVGVSDAIKLGVGLYTALPVGTTSYAIRKPHSISYREMTPAKWESYVKRVAPFVLKKILPDVKNPVAQDDLLRMLNKWLYEVEREGAREQAA